MAKIEREYFIRRLQPIIDHQVSLYWRNPDGYVRDHIPLVMAMYFNERAPSKTIALAGLLAECLIATHRVPTAAYIWRLMHDLLQPDGTCWQPHRDPELKPILETLPTPERPDTNQLLHHRDPDDEIPF